MHLNKEAITKKMVTRPSRKLKDSTKIADVATSSNTIRSPPASSYDGKETYVCVKSKESGSARFIKWKEEPPDFVTELIQYIGWEDDTITIEDFTSKINDMENNDCEDENAVVIIRRTEENKESFVGIQNAIDNIKEGILADWIATYGTCIQVGCYSTVSRLLFDLKQMIHRAQQLSPDRL